MVSNRPVISSPSSRERGEGGSGKLNKVVFYYRDSPQTKRNWVVVESLDITHIMYNL